MRPSRWPWARRAAGCRGRRRRACGGVVDLATGEPLDPLAGLGRLVGGADAGPEPGVVRAVGVPVGQRRHGVTAAAAARDLVAVEPGEHLAAQPDPGPGWHRQGGERRHGLLHLVQRHTPRLALLVQGAHVRGEPVGGGAPGGGRRGDPRGRRVGCRGRARPRPRRPRAGRAGRAVDQLAATRRRPWAPECRSSTRSPRPTRSSRPTTASMAARFSATKSTRLPSAASVAIRLAMVCDLPVPGGPVHDEVRAGAHRLDGLLLAAVGVEHEHVALGVVEVDPAAVELGAHRAQGVGVAGERRDDVVVGERVALGGEVGHHRQLGVREGADDQARGHREVGHAGAGLRQRGVDRVGVEHGVGGGQRLDGVLVEGDALLGRQVVDEHRVELELGPEVELVVALGRTGRAQGARPQQHGRRGRAGCRAPVGQPGGPGRHAHGEEAGEDAALLGELAALGRDRPGPAAGVLEGRRLADQLGQLRRAAGHHARDPAGVGGGEVEGAGGQVAVPEQGVAPAEVDEVAGPGGPGGRHPGRARVVVGRRSGVRRRPGRGRRREASVPAAPSTGVASSLVGDVSLTSAG